MSPGLREGAGAEAIARAPARPFSTPARRSARSGRRAPGPRGLRLLGCALEVRRDPLALVSRLSREFGDLVDFGIGRRRIFLVSHPEYARHVLQAHPERYGKGLGLTHARALLGNGLLTSEGELWSTQHRLLRPAFARSRLEAYAASAVHATDAMIESWRDGQRVDLGREMVRLTLEVLGRTVLGIDLREAAGELAEQLRQVCRWAMKRMSAVVPWPPGLDSLRHRSAREALRGLDERIHGWIRHPEPAPEGSLFDLLRRRRPPLDEKQIRDELLTFILAGHETSAAALAWTWDRVARDGALGERLEREVDEVLDGRPPGFADLPNLAFARMLIQEVLRLHPPVWLIPRRALTTDEVAGVPISAGSEVLICVYTIHRHPDFWEAPEELRPDRFAAVSPPRSLAQGYLPFGHGPRACLGHHLGLTEIAMVTARLAQRCRFEALAAGPPEAEPLLTLQPRQGPWVRVRKLRSPETGQRCCG